jgi:hypothetical protein
MRLTVHGRYTDFGLVSVGLNVRFGSLADIRTAQSYVRFTPNSGHVRRTTSCLLSANSGHFCQLDLVAVLCQAARPTRRSISLRSAPKSIGLVKSVSAPFSKALRLVSASP